VPSALGNVLLKDEHAVFESNGIMRILTGSLQIAVSSKGTKTLSNDQNLF